MIHCVAIAPPHVPPPSPPRALPPPPPTVRSIRPLASLPRSSLRPLVTPSQEKLRAVSEYLQYREIPPAEKLQVTVNHGMF